MQGFFAENYSQVIRSELDEEGFAPVVVGKQLGVIGAEDQEGGVEGFDRGEAACGVACDLACARVGGAEVPRQSARERLAGEAAFEGGEQAPGGIEQEERTGLAVGIGGVGAGELGAVKGEQEVAGGVEKKTLASGVESESVPAAQGFEAALAEAFLGVAEDDDGVAQHG